MTKTAPRVSLCGSHRTGKTTTFEAIQAQRPDWHYIPEPARYLIPIIGFENPPAFLQQYGIAFLQSIQLSHFCLLDPHLNPTLRDLQNPLLVDRSPLDYLAYYTQFCTPDQDKYEDVLLRLTRHYAQWIDLFILFPTDVFTLPDEPMQGLAIQHDIDALIQRMLVRLSCRVHRLQSTSPPERTREIIDLLEQHGT